MFCNALVHFIYSAVSGQCFHTIHITYTTIRHTKTYLYFCKRTVLKLLCYKNIYAEKYDRNVHTLIGGSHSE